MKLLHILAASVAAVCGGLIVLALAGEESTSPAPVDMDQLAIIFEPSSSNGVTILRSEAHLAGGLPSRRQLVNLKTLVIMAPGVYFEEVGKGRVKLTATHVFDCTVPYYETEEECECGEVRVWTFHVKAEEQVWVNGTLHSFGWMAKNQPVIGTISVPPVRFIRKTE